eukprot:gene11948-3467_t
MPMRLWACTASTPARTTALSAVPPGGCVGSRRCPRPGNAGGAAFVGRRAGRPPPSPAARVNGEAVAKAEDVGRGERGQQRRGRTARRRFGCRVQERGLRMEFEPSLVANMRVKAAAQIQIDGQPPVKGRVGTAGIVRRVPGDEKGSWARIRFAGQEASVVDGASVDVWAGEVHRAGVQKGWRLLAIAGQRSAGNKFDMTLERRAEEKRVDPADGNSARGDVPQYGGTREWDRAGAAKGGGGAELKVGARCKLSAAGEKRFNSKPRGDNWLRPGESGVMVYWDGELVVAEGGPPPAAGGGRVGPDEEGKGQSQGEERESGESLTKKLEQRARDAAQLSPHRAHAAYRARHLHCIVPATMPVSLLAAAAIVASSAATPPAQRKQGFSGYEGPHFGCGDATALGLKDSWFYTWMLNAFVPMVNGVGQLDNGITSHYAKEWAEKNAHYLLGYNEPDTPPNPTAHHCPLPSPTQCLTNHT